MRLVPERLAALLILTNAFAQPARSEDVIPRDYPANHIQMRLSKIDAATLDVLLVCDTDAHEIGATCERDLENMKLFFEHGMAGRQKLAITTLSADRVNKTNIMDHYKTLKSDADWSLVFYYSGHGGCDISGLIGTPDTGAEPIQRGHYLSLSSGERLSHLELREAMKSRAHRLVLLLSDCCDNRAMVGGRGIGVDVLEQLLEVKKGDTTKKTNGATFDSLFLKSCGTVDIVAASFPLQTVHNRLITELSKGETAACNDDVGGVFTHTLIEMLKMSPRQLTTNTKFPDDTNVDWVQMWGKLQRATLYTRLGMAEDWSKTVDPKDRADIIRRAQKYQAANQKHGEQHPVFFMMQGQ